MRRTNLAVSYNPEPNRKHHAKTIICILIYIFAWFQLGMWLLAQRPIPIGPTRSGQLMTQEAIDVQQNTKLDEIQAELSLHAMTIVELQADRNWLMGGLAAIGGLAVVVQLMQMVAIRKKE